MLNVHHPLSLFIVKKTHHYEGHHVLSSGLKNSARFVVEALLREGHRARLVEAIDANCIDRIVTEERPTHVVIEALWVTPGKMEELKRLHPRIRWTMRIHSETPFLANEGIAVEWITAYLKMGVDVAFNSVRAGSDFGGALGRQVTYLPNLYPLRKPRHQRIVRNVLQVGCFGAIRPLKNQLIQAMAAVQYVRRDLPGARLAFHMNGGRIEQSGSSNLKNITALMQATGNTLVLHPWMPHEEFLELVANMDVCLQVSLSESFCIVASDAVSMGVPLVGSDAIAWLPKRSRAKVNDAASIAEAMARADGAMIAMNHAALDSYLEESIKIWNVWVCR